jgi:hypothetical protein
MQLGKLFNALALGGAPAQARAIAPSIGEMIADTVVANVLGACTLRPPPR